MITISHDLPKIALRHWISTGGLEVGVAMLSVNSIASAFLDSLSSCVPLVDLDRGMYLSLVYHTLVQ
jgi:hypothetical protein